MPRPGLPPTPASSTEIRGKEQFEAIEDFSLPPAAWNGSSSSPQLLPQPEANSANADGSSGAAKRKRRKPSMNVETQSPVEGVVGETVFSLPPPPSRSRKIIQVQPEDAKGPSSKASGQGRKKGESGKGGNGGNGAPKSTAASRKTARKTAHSIIERRRRSKMNDEFETLKELVPAARGQNMHKLAILQAGIEYVRYLEDCIQGLQGAHSAQSGIKSTALPAPTDSRPASSIAQQEDAMEDDEEDEMDDDEEEADGRHIASTPKASRSASGHHSRDSASSTPSPLIHPLHSHQSSSSYAISTGSPSPAILPSYGTMYPSTATSSTLPSPALLPHDGSGTAYATLASGQVTPITSSSEYHALQAHAKKALAFHGEEDQEVIATLTMMGTERRRSQEEKERMDGTRGMSVRDLLSG